MKFFANPVLVKELRGRIRGTRPMVLLTIYLSLTGLITILAYLAIAESLSFGGRSVEAGRIVGKGLFLTVMTVTLIQVCVIIPSLTAGSIAGEKERQSYDLLISTLLSPLQIALGKLGAALAYAMLLIMAALPLAGLSFLFGGVSGLELVIGIVGLVVTSVLYATVGLFWSTVMRGTLGATVMSLGSIVLLLLIVPFIFAVTSVFVDRRFNAWNDVVYVYVMGAWLCTHPFIALGMTEAFISDGQNPFFFTLPWGGADILVPSPWLAFTFIGLLFSALFLFLSVRLLKPVQYGLPRAKSKQLKSNIEPLKR
ncbi:MAG: ABC transporter permease [Chloroflexales bacterium]|nr:ABC transporter permease [Chloroflexales bacterium]